MRQLPAIFALFVVLATAVAPVGLAAATQEDCSFPVTETDATGTEVTIDEEPERIVTLGPSAAQTMWEIGAEERVVGVTQFAEYLDGADQRENVSGSGQNAVNIETVVALEPDLVLAPNVIPEEDVETLREAGVTVYKFGYAANVQDVAEKTALTGRLVGECAGADETVTQMNEEIATVEETVEGQDGPRVLYVFFGYTAGEGTLLDEIITTAGGTNVAAEAGIEGYQPISEETVVEADPEWLVLNSDGPTVPDSEAYNSTTAVQQGQTVVVDANYVSQPAPRIVNPITTLAEAFYPEDYAADATETTTTETGQPGFTAAMAFVSLALAGLLTRRR